MSDAANGITVVCKVGKDRLTGSNPQAEYFEAL